MGKLDQITLDYISALRKIRPLDRAIDSLSKIAGPESENSPAEDSGQFFLDLEMGIVLVSDPPEVVVAKKWLHESARWVRVSSKDEEERWNSFLVIADVIGLAKAIDWVIGSTNLCAPGEQSSYERTRAA